MGKRKHGHTRKPEYSCWQSIIQRCTNPNNQRYEYYGGRGIKVCDRWIGESGFDNFLSDLGEKPEPKSKYSIERLDNDGNYEPSNCRWILISDQGQNRRPPKRKPHNKYTGAITETQRLLQALLDAGLRYEDIASRTGAHVNSVKNWHKGKKAINIYKKQLIKILNERRDEDDE